MNIEHLKNYILELCPSEKPAVIVGLSGGPDSVFLFHLLRELSEEKKITLIAAHLNHGWRESAQRDEEFCKKLCETFHITFECAHANDITSYKKSKGSKEAEGRNKRRAFFEQLAKKHNAHAIALAHHADDQIETFFIRLIRGATLDGLCAMKQKNGLYIRPLLTIPKVEIVNSLNENNYHYCHDESNESMSYLRNRIRTNVLPELQKCDPRFTTKFLSTLNLLQEENEFLKELTHTAFNSVFILSDEGYEGNLDSFKSLAPTLQRRVLLLWFIKEKLPFSPSLSHLEEIQRFLLSPRGGKHLLYRAIHLLKVKNTFRLNKN